MHSNTDINSTSEASKQEAKAKEHWVLEGEHKASEGSGLVRTFMVFVGLPIHIEYQVAPMPILDSGRIIDLDLSLRHPKDPRKVRKIQGPHIVSSSKLRYESDGRPSRKGLSQYLEMKIFELAT